MFFEQRILDQYSSRAQRLLKTATRGYETPSPESTRRWLINRKFAVFQKVLDFEQKFGGVELVHEQRGVQLGLRFCEKQPVDGEEVGEVAIPVGKALNGTVLLLMNESGEVISYDDAVVMKSSSIETYFEQEAIRPVRHWSPPYFFAIVIPCQDKKLSRRLNLKPVDTVSDQYARWYEAEEIFIEQIAYEAAWQSRSTIIWAHSLSHLNNAINAAQKIYKNLKVSIGGFPGKYKYLRGKKKATLNRMEGLLEEPDVIRLEYGEPQSESHGIIAICRDDTKVRIEQFRFLGKNLIAWDNIDSDGETIRLLP